MADKRKTDCRFIYKYGQFLSMDSSTLKEILKNINFVYWYADKFNKPWKTKF